MKTIQLTDDLQRFLHEAVHSGRYAERRFRDQRCPYSAAASDQRG